MNSQESQVMEVELYELESALNHVEVAMCEAGEVAFDALEEAEMELRSAIAELKSELGID